MAGVTGTVTTEAVAARLADVRGRIETAGGDPARVRVVGVTKGFGRDTVAAAAAAGLVDLGENYAQELLGKVEAAPGARWHFVGRLQRNKVAALGRMVHLWQTVDRPELAETIARHAPGGAVLVQVNVSGEARKGGCRADDTDTVVERSRALGLDVQGLMAVGPTGPPEAARPGFGWLAATARRLGLGELSMGMTDDLEVAVQEGATIVRVGRGLFGPRPAGTTTLLSAKEGSGCQGSDG